MISLSEGSAVLYQHTFQYVKQIDLFANLKIRLGIQGMDAANFNVLRS